MKIVGKGYRIDELQAYLDTVQMGSWKPELIVIHHTAAPSLAQRPSGFLSQHMLNLQDFYEGKGWSAGPHFFVDEDQVWVFSPMNAKGVHAVSFNRDGVGIELLGNFDEEDPWSGRGLEVLKTTRFLVKMLEKKLGLTDAAIRFHRDDKTTNKTCPGKKIGKQQFLDFLKESTS